jgi:hypothetical protein
LSQAFAEYPAVLLALLQGKFEFIRTNLGIGNLLLPLREPLLQLASS